MPSPDLRDHNTVVKEIHNYVSRLSGHLLSYPRFAPEGVSVDGSGSGGEEVAPVALGREQEETPMDVALRELIRRVQPFGLTKGEVLMVVNLGVGVGGKPAVDGEGTAEGTAEGDGDGEKMDVDQSVHTGQVNGDAEEGEDEGADLPEEDYGALALLDTVIEEREERLSNEQVAQILAIIRETLGSGAR